MDKCEVCGSDRLLKGSSFGEADKYTCQDCGSTFGAEIPSNLTPTEIRSQLPEIPTSFDSVEEAQAHLAKLKEAASRLGRTKGDVVTKPKRKVHPTSDVDPKVVMAELHYYQRENEAWQSVLATAKGEREVRNFNVLIFAHNHYVGVQCTPTCREVIENG